MNVSIIRAAYLQHMELYTPSVEKHLLVANALSFIINNVFPNISNTFGLTVAASVAPVKFLFNDMISKLFANWGLVAVQLVVQATKPPRSYCCYALLIDSFESLKKTNLAAYNRNRDSLEYYYIFLQTDDKSAVNEMQLIFKYCFDNYWLNCNVMVHNSIGEILVYTYFPFKENNCFQTQPEIINKFKQNHFISNTIFPNKLSNLKGCPIKVTTWETPPFVVNKTNKNYKKYNVTGCEMVMINHISEAMNFTPIIEWLSFNKNHSPDHGLLKKLQNRETNITAGFLRRTKQRDNKVTPTFITYFIPLTMLTLRKVAQHESMHMLTFPFDSTTWTLAIIVFVIVGIMEFLQTRNIQNSVFKTLEVAVGLPTKIAVKKTSSRVRLMTTLLGSFMIRTFYQSLLFFVFSFNFYLSPPITLNEVVSEGYKAVSTEFSKQFLLNIPEVANKTLPLITTNSSSEMSPIHYIDQHGNENLVAISITEFAMRYLHEETTSKATLRALPIDIKDQQITYYLAKHSYLVDNFNDYILRLHQSGLIYKWREWANSDFKIRRRNVVATAYGSTFMFDLKQFAGFISLMVTLHVTSIVLFVLELLSQKFVCLKRIL